MSYQLVYTCAKANIFTCMEYGPVCTLVLKIQVGFHYMKYDDKELEIVV